jgi:hypothetical protein
VNVVRVWLFEVALHPGIVGQTVALVGTPVLATIWAVRKARH